MYCSFFMSLFLFLHASFQMVIAKHFFHSAKMKSSNHKKSYLSHLQIGRRSLHFDIYTFYGGISHFCNNIFEWPLHSLLLQIQLDLQKWHLLHTMHSFKGHSCSSSLCYLMVISQKRCTRFNYFFAHCVAPSLNYLQELKVVKIKKMKTQLR